jgi:hypothetical protein
METLKQALTGVGILLGIVWLGVFVIALFGRIRGRSAVSFTVKDIRLLHCPQLPLPWWHWVRLLFYCSAFLLFIWGCVLILPPMFVIELPARLKARCSSEHKELHHDDVA